MTGQTPKFRDCYENSNADILLAFGGSTMAPKGRNQLNTLLHPFIFVLKEGQEFKKNNMDYSLMMVFVHPQFLKSDGKKIDLSSQGIHVNAPQNRIGGEPTKPA
jgi:hypothetical protein